MQRFVKFPVAALVGLVWAVIGLVVALGNDYGQIDSGSDAWTLVLAIVLWPFLLAGADVAIRF
jgi:hypothetical protein